MTKSRTAAVAVVLTTATVLSACGSSGNKPTSNASATPGSTASGGTYTIGLLTDLTGPAASGNQTSVEGVKAGIAAVASTGYKFKLVVTDTGTSPTGALAAAQKLVTRDHVFAVISVSALAFAAAPYLTAHNVPVIGSPEDGPEWLTRKNMFSVVGHTDVTKVADTLGLFMKSQGASNLGSVGYGISPLSALAAKSAGASAEAAGLKAGYVNANLPFGTTDLGPVALRIKSAGVDAVTASTDPNTGLSLITTLRRNGVDLKAPVLPNGYGGELSEGGPGAAKNAQGVFFYVPFEPVEMHTSATKRFASALESVGVTAGPTLPEYFAYASVALLVSGLQAAGKSPTPQGLIAALPSVHSFDALGLLGSHPLDVGSTTPSPFGIDNCIYFTQLEGTTFKLVSGADPLCGSLVSGKTVH